MAHITTYRDFLRLILTNSLFLLAMFCYGQEYLYGLTQYGGFYNKGVPYQITTDGKGFISNVDFDGDIGDRPGNGAAFVQLSNNQLSNGLIVALTEYGYENLGLGSRIAINPGKGGYVPTFIPVAPYTYKTKFTQGADGTGINPGGRLLVATDGTEYGLTSKDGRFGGGALFGGVLIPFDGPLKGKSPKGSLIQGSNGKLFGMTELGGINNLGVIFSVDISTLDKTLNKIFDFDGIAKGANPTGNLTLATDGRLYGMAKSGGSNGMGIIFTISQDGTGFKKLFDFSGVNDGSTPLGSLTEFTDGKLYGMTSSGGAKGYGVIFSITTTGSFTKVFDFDGPNGKAPVGDLLVAPNGKVMYGVTYYGGVSDKGVLFKLENGKLFSKLYDYEATTGCNPVGSLTMLRQVPKFNFPPITEKNTLDESFTPLVESSANIPVYFTSNNVSVASIENNKIKVNGPGIATITAFQLGNYAFLSQSATQTIVVKKVNQVIQFASIPSKTYGDPDFKLEASSSSGLPVTFSISYSSDNVATNNGELVSIKNAGIASIRAIQAGNSIYNAALVAQDLVVNKAEQTIEFQPNPIKYCCSSFNLSAKASSKLEVSFKTVNRDKLDINGSFAQIKKLGNVEIVAYQNGNVNFKPKEVKVTITILKGAQKINFSTPSSNITFGTPPQYIYAGSDSGLPVTFTSSIPGVAVVEGSSLIAIGVGSTTITATQDGNDLFNSASPVSVMVTVKKPSTPLIGNTISWQDLPSKFMNDSPFNLAASASSGLPVSYSSSNTAVADISGNLVKIKGAGATTITAVQLGTDSVAAAIPVQKVLQVKKQSQFINFQSLPSVNFGNEPIPLPITTSAGLPITYSSSNIAVAAITDYLLYINGGGVATITATQSGDAIYSPALSINQQIRVNQIYQTINFNVLPTKTFGDSPFKLQASTTSGLPVTFSSSDQTLVSIDGDILTIKGAGTITITATQIGSSGYLSNKVSQQLVVNKAKQKITFNPLPDKKFGDAPFEISSSSDSNLPVTFVSLTPAVAKVNSKLITIIGNGIANIIATQSGTENYLPAENVSQSFQVSDIGNLYDLFGFTVSGGANQGGVVYSMNSEGENYNILKQFDMKTIPRPQGGFIKGTDGKLYGNLFSGGKFSNGRIVRLEADGTGLTVLYDYNPSISGASAYGNLCLASNGYLFGMTYSGGMNGGGTIFRLKPDGSEFTTLFNFTQSSGNNPLGGLTEATNGLLYGITPNGGFFGSGTIFSVTPDGSDFKVIFNINDASPIRSGVSPRGDLLQGQDGFLYGTMSQGGSNGKGTIFKIKADGSAFKKIIDFNGLNNGSMPASTLLLGSDGKIYGMTQLGGTNNLGTIFSLNTDGTNFSLLQNFDGLTKGANPIGKLTEASNGALYGMTYGGGVNSRGTIFSVSKNGASFQKIMDFDLRAASPVFGPLVESLGGVFYGMTSKGGSSDGGVIFSITSNGSFKIVKDFPQQGEFNPLSLISDPLSENLYGTVSFENNLSIFKMNTSGSSYQRIIQSPNYNIGKIFYLSNGYLWCIASQDGKFFIFKIKPDGSEFQKVLDFDNTTQKGLIPRWLVETSSGDIFGIGSVNASGLIFKVNEDGANFTKLSDLPSGIDTGYFMQASDGGFYLCSLYNSILYKFTESGSFTKIFTFPKEAGEVPIKIIELSGGSLGIITRDHGTGGHGSIFTVEKDGTGYSKIYDPTIQDGTSPTDLLQTLDGWIYVSTMYGGKLGKGAVYKVKGAGTSSTKIRDFNGEDGSSAWGLIFKKKAQSFTFDPLGEKKVSDAPFLPIASSTSGAVIQFSSSDPKVAVIENGKIKPVGVGTVMITASLPSNANFFSAPSISRQLIVTKGDQTINFAPLSTVSINSAPFLLKASSTSFLPISYQSSNSEIATVDGNMVTIKGVGTTIITASQSGNENSRPATSVQQQLVVTKADQIITFDLLAPVSFISAPFQLKASSTSLLSVSYQSSNTSVASITGSTLTIKGVGIATITASQLGNERFLPASDVQQQLVVTKANQTLKFDELVPVTFGIAPLELKGTSSSLLPLSYQSSNNSIGSVAGNILTIHGAGIITITATQSGNENFLPAVNLQQQLVITKANQTIKFDPLEPLVMGSPSVELKALSTSLLPVNYKSSNTSVAIIEGNLLTIKGIGTTTITASQTGNENFLSAPTVQQELLIRTITGTEESEIIIDVFPNPALEEFSVRIRGQNFNGANSTIYLSDMMGRKIQEKKVTHPLVEIFDIRMIESGIYLLSVEMNGMTSVRKLIKK